MKKQNLPDICTKPSCEQLINIIPGPFVIIDRDYHIIAANQAYLKQYHSSAEDILGKCCHEVSHHSAVPCSQHGEHCPLEEVFRTGQPTQVMHVHYDDNGQEEYVQLQASPIFSEDGQPLYMGEFIQTAHRSLDEDTLLLGKSLPLLRMTSLLQRVAPTKTSVLLEGESGVGKERVAEYIHQYSERSEKPLLIVDCSTLGENLIENELFGHEKGAFTGATSKNRGMIEAADKGTLLIDEIGELPLPLQTKLLRVLETGTIRRVGGTDYTHVNVRFIAATNRNLQEMVAKGSFRQDLYFRLSAFPIKVPPLRERKDDIALLAEHFISRTENGERFLPLSPEVIEKLMQYEYPGNVRELRNIIERAQILAIDDDLRPEHVIIENMHTDTINNSPDHHPTNTIAGRRLRAQDVAEALQHTNGHRLRAAQQLGISERTLYRHLKRLK